MRGRGGWSRWLRDVRAWLRAVDVDVGGEIVVEVGSGGDQEVELVVVVRTSVGCAEQY
jgi:hypothetical protein